MCILHFSRSPLADHVFKAAGEAEKWPFFPGPVLGRGRGCLDRITITAGSLFIIFRPRGAQALKSSCTGGCRGRWSGRGNPGSSEATWSQSPLLTQPHAACWLAASSTGRETQHPTSRRPRPGARRAAHQRWGCSGQRRHGCCRGHGECPAPHSPAEQLLAQTSSPAFVLPLFLHCSWRLSHKKNLSGVLSFALPSTTWQTAWGQPQFWFCPCRGRGGSDILPLLVKPFSFLYTHLLLLLC